MQRRTSNPNYIKYRTDRETNERFFFCPKKAYTIIIKKNISIPSNKKRKHQNTNYIILFTFPSRAASRRFWALSVSNIRSNFLPHTLSLSGVRIRSSFLRRTIAISLCICLFLFLTYWIVVWFCFCFCQATGFADRFHFKLSGFFADERGFFFFLNTPFINLLTLLFTGLFGSRENEGKYYKLIFIFIFLALICYLLPFLFSGYVQT